MTMLRSYEITLRVNVYEKDSAPWPSRTTHMSGVYSKDSGVLASSIHVGMRLERWIADNERFTMTSRARTLNDARQTTTTQAPD